MRSTMKQYRERMNMFVRSAILFIAMVAVAACGKDPVLEDSIADTTTWERVKVAVVVPLSGGSNHDIRYKRISKYFEENAIRAQHQWDDGLLLELEWYDETTEDLHALARSFEDRTDLAAVIGPIKDENIDIMANRLSYGDIPMFVMSPSEELLRRYSCGTAGVTIKEPFLWSLCEPDITQAQLLLYKVSTSGGRKVSLVSAANMYGDTYYKWVPFHAVETKLEMVDNQQYSSLSELELIINNMLASDTEYIICALNDIDDVRVVLEASQRQTNGPKLLFTGSVFNGDVLSLGELAEGMEGLSLYSSPNTGFHLAYNERYGEFPKPYESQFYDALLLSFIAANFCHYGGWGFTMNDTVKAISDIPLTEELDLPEFYEWGKGTPIWDHYYLGASVLTPIRAELFPELNLLGASGNFKFAAETYTSLVQSTYINWIIYNGKPVVLDFVAAKGSRVSNYQVAWLYQNTFADDLESSDTDITYPAIEDRWAVLVCSSDGWSNYRHQADLLNFYHFIKVLGMTDDHIILIMQDDIAYHEKNPYPGIIRSLPEGDNLYCDFELDYKLGDIAPADIVDILTGKKSERLPTVLESTANDNVTIYWTGHGSYGSFSWLKDDKFTYEQLHSSLAELHDDGRYRQLLILTEPCHSGSMACAVEGFVGMLGISSSDHHESSFADHYNRELKAWMCDRFTNNFVSSMSDDLYMSFHELYVTLNTSTMGSHVRIYNQQNFDNLHYSYPVDFFAE